MDRGREGAFVRGGAWRREAVRVGVIGAVATVASAVLVLRTQTGAFVIGGALGLTFVAFGLFWARGVLAGRSRFGWRRAITEYRITADRIVTAAGEDGDVWWLFRIDAGGRRWVGVPVAP